MTNYTPSDFSPIFGPDEKPVNPGSYPSGAISGHEYCLERFNNRLGATEFRNGKWYWIDSGESCIIQKRYWFGLNKKP